MTKLATNSFELALPDNWRIETLQNPATVIGPGSECLMVNSAVVSGGGSERGLAEVRSALQQNADDSMQQAASNPRLRVTIPLRKEDTTDGWLFAELHGETVDGTAYFSEFSIAGPTTLVFVTLEGPIASKASTDLVRTAVRNIRWAHAGPESPPKAAARKPFWKLW